MTKRKAPEEGNMEEEDGAGVVDVAVEWYTGPQEQWLFIAQGTSLFILDVSSPRVVAVLTASQHLRTVRSTSCKKYIAVAGDGKTVQLLGIEKLRAGIGKAAGALLTGEASEYTESETKPHGKKITCLVPVPPAEEGDETNKLLFSDKVGEVYSVSAPGLADEKFELGHISLLTKMDLAIASTGKRYILTSDRDEKIRVTRFPNTNVIEGYCLGHTAFVSTFSILHAPDGQSYIASGGGDGSLRLWSLPSATPLCSLSLGGEEAGTVLCTHQFSLGGIQFVVASADTTPGATIYRLDHEGGNLTKAGEIGTGTDTVLQVVSGAPSEDGSLPVWVVCNSDPFCRLFTLNPAEGGCVTAAEVGLNLEQSAVKLQFDAESSRISELSAKRRKKSKGQADRAERLAKEEGEKRAGE